MKESNKTIEKGDDTIVSRIGKWRWLEVLRILQPVSQFTLGMLAVILTVVVPIVLYWLAKDDTNSPSVGNPPIVVVGTEIRSAIDDTIGRIASTQGNSLFQARQRLELLLGRIEAIVKTFGDMSYDQIEEQEQRVLTDLLRLFAKLSEHEKIEPQEIFQRVSEADGWIESLSKADDLPTITKMKPLYVSSQELDQNEAIEITFTGTHLAHKSVSLKIQDKPCDIATPAGSATSNVTFRCKTEHYGKWEPSSSISGELTLIHSPYFRWLSWLLDPMEFRYRVSLPIIPEHLGRFTVDISVRDEQTEVEERSQEFSAQNAHCRGGREARFEFNSSRDWNVDKDSISVECSSSKKSSCKGLRDVKDTSFKYACHLENHGSCDPLRILKDGRGSCWGRVTWNDIQSTVEPRRDVLGPFELAWGDEQPIGLPENAQSVRLVLTKFDGNRSVLSIDDPEDKWVTAQIDLERQKVLVRALPLEQAMSLPPRSRDSAKPM